MKRRPFRVNFENVHHMHADQLVESEVLLSVLKKEVPKAINAAIKEKKTYATVFEINTFGVFVEIHKKDWISALNSCIEMHAKKEEYEVCVEINKTVELLSKKLEKHGRVERV
jgi:hypothetical protein